MCKNDMYKYLKPFFVNNSSYSSNALDEIYHSNSAYEMQVKADLLNIDIYDISILQYLIETTAYHHAYWPHTAKRFVALKSLLRKSKDLPKKEWFVQLLTDLENNINEFKTDKWRMHTPGGKQHLKNLIQVLDILKKLSLLYESKHESK